jgi:hypothetical protein
MAKNSMPNPAKTTMGASINLVEEKYLLSRPSGKIRGILPQAQRA